MTTTPRHRRTSARAVRALILVLALTAGCGDDDDGAATSTTTTTAAGSFDSPTVEITAVDYDFEDLPAELQAGAALSLRNQSTREVHELVAMQLPDGERRTPDELVALPEDELRALFAGPPALVLVAPPEDEAFTAVGDGTLAEPGRYLLMCFIPTGANPAAYLDALHANTGQPPSVPGGPPHFTAGMHGELTVR